MCFLNICFLRKVVCMGGKVNLGNQITKFFLVFGSLFFHKNWAKFYDVFTTFFSPWYGSLSTWIMKTIKKINRVDPMIFKYNFIFYQNPNVNPEIMIFENRTFLLFFPARVWPIFLFQLWFVLKKKLKILDIFNIWSSSFIFTN